MIIVLSLPPEQLEDNATLNAAIIAFGITDQDVREARRTNERIHLRVSEDTFGKFVALRVVYGCSNNYIRCFNLRIEDFSTFRGKGKPPFPGNGIPTNSHLWEAENA